MSGSGAGILVVVPLALAGALIGASVLVVTGVGAVAGLEAEEAARRIARLQRAIGERDRLLVEFDEDHERVRRRELARQVGLVPAPAWPPVEEERDRPAADVDARIAEILAQVPDGLVPADLDKLAQRARQARTRPAALTALSYLVGQANRAARRRLDAFDALDSLGGFRPLPGDPGTELDAVRADLRLAAEGNGEFDDALRERARELLAAYLDFAHASVLRDAVAAEGFQLEPVQTLVASGGELRAVHPDWPDHALRVSHVQERQVTVQVVRTGAATAETDDAAQRAICEQLQRIEAELGADLHLVWNESLPVEDGADDYRRLDRTEKTRAVERPGGGR